MDPIAQNNCGNSPFEYLTGAAHPELYSHSQNSVLLSILASQSASCRGQFDTAGSIMENCGDKLWSSSLDSQELDDVKCKLNFDSPVVAKQEPIGLRRTGGPPMRISISQLR